MTTLFPAVSGLLAIFAGLAHSYLGERRILWRLFADDTSEALKKGRMRELIRAVWHVPSLAWVVPGLALVHTGINGGGSPVLAITAGTVFTLSGAANWIALRGFHFGGAVLVAAGLLAFAGAAGF